MVMYYWAREFSSALLTGQGYSTLPRTIVISIVDFKLFMGEEYHSFFQLLEITRHTLLSDKMEFYSEIFVYDRKRVEIHFKFKDEWENLLETTGIDLLQKNFNFLMSLT